MKTLWLLISFLLVGCGCKPYPNDLERRQAVIDALKSTDIQALPGYSDRFVGRTTNGSIWYLLVDLQANVTKTILLEPQQ